MPNPRTLESTPSHQHRGLKYALAGVALAAMTFTLVAASSRTAEAGKPGGGSSSTASITLNQSSPRLGDMVTFSYFAPKNGSELRIAVVCYQSGVGVAWATDQVAGTPFLLGGTESNWVTNGGPADCVAFLFRRNVADGELARTNFSVGG